MTPTTRDMEEADRLLAELAQMVQHDPDEQAVCWDGQAQRTIAQALAARTEQAVKDATTAACAVAAHRSAVPPGHVRHWDGRVVRVLGTPVETGDGAWVFPGATGLFDKGIEDGEEGWVALTTGHPDHVEHSHFTWIGTNGMGAVVSTSLFSTREAALAAKEKS